MKSQNFSHNFFSSTFKKRLYIFKQYFKIVTLPNEHPVTDEELVIPTIVNGITYLIIPVKLFFCNQNEYFTETSYRITRCHIGLLQVVNMLKVQLKMYEVRYQYSDMHIRYQTRCFQNCEASKYVSLSWCIIGRRV